MVYCSEACGNECGGKKGQGGVGLAVREKITGAIVHPTEFINERLLKVKLKSRGRASAVAFVVAYGPTKSSRDEGKKRSFCTAFGRAVNEVPRHEQLFVLMDANARTGRRGGGGPGSEHCGVLGAYGGETHNETMVSDCLPLRSTMILPW